MAGKANSVELQRSLFIVFLLVLAAVGFFDHLAPHPDSWSRLLRAVEWISGTLLVVTGFSWAVSISRQR